MSRSYRKTPVWGNVGGGHSSQKKEKRLANRALRTSAKARLRHGLVLPVMREVSNVNTWKQDGKKYHGWGSNDRDPLWKERSK